nr:NADP-dependent oxidoreductase [Nocardioides immobilis]
MEFDGPEGLQVIDRELPDPAPGAVRIRVRAATVNPADTGFARGVLRAMLRHEPPHVPGMEAAGVVDAVGEGVDDLAIGDRVMAVVLPLGRNGGAQSERIVVPRASVARTPDHLSDAEAATVPMNGLTAIAALDVLNLAPGEWLWVTGAPGALGGYTVQLAKDRGLRVVADASDADEQLVYDLGADLVVSRGADSADRVRLAVDGGVAGVVDGALLNSAVAPAVRPGGTIVAVRPFEGPAPSGIKVELVMVADYIRDAERIERLRDAAARGVITPRIAELLPFEMASAAYRAVEAGGTRGRIVLTF